MRSMTGFASVDGALETPTDGGAMQAWRWDARSVNGRGADVKFRLPPGFDAQEAQWRKRAGAAFARGSISFTLTLGDGGGAVRGALDADALAETLTALTAIAEAAKAAGAPTSPATLDGLLRAPGVFGPPRSDEAGGRSPALIEAADTGFDAALEALSAARAAEGAALKAVITGQLDGIEALVAKAEARAAARQEAMAARLRDKVTELLAAGADASGAIDEGRLAQELAMLAVKADVREELDRLNAHVAAARALAGENKPVGRRFDFLSQEFNREANTLCAKAQDSALTEIGLDLKVAIDQLKEQAANVE